MRQTWDTTWHSRGTTWLWDEGALPALGPPAGLFHARIT
jgi:hypothetical protein